MVDAISYIRENLFVALAHAAHSTEDTSFQEMTVSDDIKTHSKGLLQHLGMGHVEILTKLAA